MTFCAVKCHNTPIAKLLVISDQNVLFSWVSKDHFRDVLIVAVFCQLVARWLHFCRRILLRRLLFARKSLILIGFERFREPMINPQIGWGARGREFKSRRPDQ